MRDNMKSVVRVLSAWQDRKSNFIHQVRMRSSFGVLILIPCIFAFFIGVASLLLSHSAAAAYNANLTGNIISLATYDNGEILVILSNQPAANGSCSAAFFELDPPGIGGSTVANDAAFNRMYARLIQAYAAGETVNLGFDNAGSCAYGGYIRVYRVG